MHRRRNTRMVVEQGTRGRWNKSWLCSGAAEALLPCPRAPTDRCCHSIAPHVKPRRPSASQLRRARNLRTPPPRGVVSTEGAPVPPLPIRLLASGSSIASSCRRRPAYSARRVPPPLLPVRPVGPASTMPSVARFCRVRAGRSRGHESRVCVQTRRTQGASRPLREQPSWAPRRGEPYSPPS